jgi:hypothetical protein
MFRVPVVHAIAATLAVIMMAGCKEPITIDPTCPSSLRVGETGPVRSNVSNPGGIPEYTWEVFPPDAGQFANPFAPDTEFTPDFEGDAIIRLTASDGLFQVISQCMTTVADFVGVSVALTASTATALVGEEVTLTCTNNGTIPSTLLAITQTDGAVVDLTSASDGVATFTPTEIGDLTFRCVGEAETGEQGEPTFLTIPVNQTEPPDGGDDGGDDGDDGGGRGGGRI